MNFYGENDITRVLKLSFKMVLIDILVDLIAVRRCDVLKSFVIVFCAVIRDIHDICLLVISSDLEFVSNVICVLDYFCSF